jgi:hypothetical protein
VQRQGLREQHHRRRELTNIFDRRNFLKSMGCLVPNLPFFTNLFKGSLIPYATGEEPGPKSYGSGHFGEWDRDEFGLPAFHYTCNQLSDPAAITPVDPAFRSPTDQMHQVGNDRLVAVVSNFGYAQVRQDEGAPKFLNDFCPERGQYGGGFGYLTDGTMLLSTYYQGGSPDKFQRTFGVGYARKQVANQRFAVDQVLFAPFGDDPVLVSQVTVENRSAQDVDLRWIEYWGCQPYQFSYRSYMQARAVGKTSMVQHLRRDFGERFSHDLSLLKGNRGLLEQKRFLGRTASDEAAWKKVQANSPELQDPGPGGSSFEDLEPPPTFLASLDAPFDGFSGNGKNFFGSGVGSPAVAHALDQDLSVHGPDCALLLERKFKLEPGQRQTLYFLYGYLPEGMRAEPLVEKYQNHTPELWTESSLRWKKDGMRFSTPEEPWVERELTWHHYYLRGNLTYDSFFGEHMLSQGHVYQYLMGFQGAARDPLQHVLPFVFSNPKIVKEILRYTLKEVRDDGSIPYGIVGHGMLMPAGVDNASDLPLWLLWAASEYVLATRDSDFLKEEVSAYPVHGPTAKQQSVSKLLIRCYNHLVNDVGNGEHGLMRMLVDDWSDALAGEHVPAQYLKEYLRTGESTLNSAMASYVFDLYARMLTFGGASSDLAADAQRRAQQHRQSVSAQWAGHWFRRAWLGPSLGWVGDDSVWIEPQPWAIIGGAATTEQARELVRSMDQLLRKPSPIGAMQVSQGSHTAEEMGIRIGTSQDGGVWPSLNGTLVWSLAQVNGEMAWDEWKKNSLARHAEVYPTIWYGAWSGPDTYNSVLNDYPGGTMLSDAMLCQRHQKGPVYCDDDLAWTDFPIMNMHPHAWQLYMIPKLLGLEFSSDGLTLAPALPLQSYRFVSPLLGLVKMKGRYEGWYAPFSRTADWTISFKLPDRESRLSHKLEVNGKKDAATFASDGTIRISGRGGPSEPLRWALQSEWK